MAKERSEVSTYLSRYGGGHVTIAQYITEYLCEVVVRSRGTELPQKFWENEDWAKFYRTQIALLNKHVITKYHPRAVVKALKDKRCRRVNSFMGFIKVPFWTKVLDEMHKACLVEDERTRQLEEHIVVDATKDKPREQLGNKSIISKLREI